MSPIQYFFPYFFNQEAFNTQLQQFGLSSYIIYNTDGSLKSVKVIKLGSFQAFKKLIDYVEMPHWTIFMIQKNKLIYWTTDSNHLKITQVNLSDLNLRDTRPLNAELEINTIDNLELAITNLGHIPGEMVLEDFVTFVRMKEIQYEQDYCDNYGIVRISGTNVSITPFDWFNKKGADYGYVWPAVAQLDESGKKLFGRGMRMADFVVDL